MNVTGFLPSLSPLCHLTLIRFSLFSPLPPVPHSAVIPGCRKREGVCWKLLINGIESRARNPFQMIHFASPSSSLIASSSTFPSLACSGTLFFSSNITFNFCSFHPLPKQSRVKEREPVLIERHYYRNNFARVTLPSDDCV